MSTKIIIIVAVVIVLAGCITAAHILKNSSDLPEMPVVDQDLEDAATSGNRFAFDLYEKLGEKDGNLFFSPASISTALAMTYAGARGNTAKEMKDALHFTLDGDKLHAAFGNLQKTLVGRKKGIELSVANALWGQKGYSFRREFLNLTNKHYDAPLTEVDFQNAVEQARETINEWTAEKTNQKIKDVLKPGILNELTRLVLTNTVYFQGTWKYQFDKKHTKTADFHLSSKISVKVDMMYMRNTEFNCIWGRDFRGLVLPYVDNNISMVIFLPHEANGLAEFEKSFTSTNLKKWLSEMHLSRFRRVGVPRFKITCFTDLDVVLTSMGMSTAFDSGKADFSGITGKKNLFISPAVHKAFIEVNEKGTEAAAVAHIGSTLNGPPVFIADHPFLFIIREKKTGAILFIGRVADPTSE